MKSRRSGQGVVEMAFVLPVFLFVLIGIIDFGRAFHVWTSLNRQCVEASRVGTKRLHQLIGRNLYTATTHESFANVEAAFWNARSPMMIQTNYSELSFDGIQINRASEFVHVSAKYELELITPFMGTLVGKANSDGKLTIYAEARERKE